jgi:hypothetical protein
LPPTLPNPKKPIRKSFTKSPIAIGNLFYAFEVGGNAAPGYCPGRCVSRFAG